MREASELPGIGLMTGKKELEQVRKRQLQREDATFGVKGLGLRGELEYDRWGWEGRVN